MSSTRTIERRFHIDNTPDAVMGYIADVRHRPLYVPHLQSVSEIEGDPSAAETRWKWTFSALGFDFEGTARCAESVPGKRYVTETETGIRSTWSYDAEPHGEGTDLTVRLEYEVPERVIPLLPTESVVENLRNTEADKMVQNLKEILDR